MKKIVVVLLLIFGTISCKKNDNGEVTPPPPVDTSGNLLHSNAFLVDSLSVSEVTETSIKLLKSKISLRPEVGDIIMSNPSVSAPLGFLRKVTSVVENGNEIFCNTVPSNLNDAFSQLKFSANYLDSFSSNATLKVETGSRLSIMFQNNDTLIRGMTINGELYFNIPSVKIEYSKKLGSVSPEKFLIQSEFNTDSSWLEFASTDNSPKQEIEKLVKEFKLPTILVPVSVSTANGIKTVSIPFSQRLTIYTLPVSISGKSKWVIRPRCSAVLGAAYDHSGWTNLTSYTIDASADSLYQGDFASPDLVGGLTLFRPELEIRPYDENNLKSDFEIPNSMNLNVMPTSPNFLLTYVMDVKGNIQQEFYTGVSSVFNIAGNVTGKILKQGDWKQENTFIDPRDGKSYHFAQFGKQVWMTENLDYGSSCYNNDPANCSVYGSLYSVWGSADPSPPGWHMPSDAEWQELINYLNSNPNAWNDFAPLPGGRYVNDLQDLHQYIEIGQMGWWWSSTNVSWPGPNDNYYNKCYSIPNGQHVATGTMLLKTYALSVRCIKDQ